MRRPRSDPARREAWALVRRATARVVVAVTVLVTAYYQIPAREVGSDLPWFLASLCVFAAVVAVQVPIIVRSDFPVIRAAEALALAIPVFLLIFARGYLSASLDDPDAFSQQLDHTDALYFTVSTFVTVGFGDIVAQSEAMRVAVTTQMILDLVVLGAVVRIFATAARRGLSARDERPDPA
ncbi:potassium channel family protein [Aeromicrobium choanae]|uniref:Ion channel n=1 Tax=Aeromicrobium choanae TaxID=1736691 RepID=A0A1T4Z9J9_9ACTN|nr:potassium channel family protein [Aeromicrobium choanae]SKB10235.1 Ion channel [Aeromicrobium choanae]